MIDINTIISQALAAAVQQATAPLLERIAALEFQSADRHARLRVLEGALTDRVAMLENQALVVSNAVDTRITASNAVVDRLHERVATREGALTDRIAALEKRVFEDLGAIIEQEFIASMAVTDVVGHDTVQALTDRIAAVETKLTEADLFTKTTEGHVNKDELLEYLDNQEWFWHKIREFTGTVVGHDTVQALTDRIAALEDNKQMTAAAFVTYLDKQEWFWGKIREFTGTVVEQAIENHTDCWDHNDFVTEDKLDDYVKTDNFRDEIEDVINNATIRLNF